MRTILILLILIFFFVLVFSILRTIPRPEPIPSPAIKTLASTAVVGMTMSKIEWDGHLWAILDFESLCHHPDCHCDKQEFEKPEETSATE